MPPPAVDSEYITLAEAARIAGHSSTSTLRTAARTGRLRTIRLSAHVQFTTRAWLDEYLKSRWVRGDAQHERATDEET